MPLPSLSQISRWPPSNYTDPETRGSSLFIVNTFFIAIAGILVLCRVFTRAFITTWLGLDDLFLGLSLVFSIVLTVGVDVGFSQFNWNRHIWDIEWRLAERSLILAFALRTVFLFAGGFVHLSFLWFYYRLTNDADVRWFRWLLYTSFFLAVSTWITFLFLGTFQCIPVQAQWKYVANSHCNIDAAKSLITGSFIKVFFDILITTLPIPLVARMKLQKKQKYGVIILFSLGYVVTAAGALRTYYTYLAETSKLGDTTWYQYPAFLWASIENDLSISCACIPTLRPLLRPILQNVRGSSIMSRWRSATGLFASSHRRTVMESPLDTGEPQDGGWIMHPFWRRSQPRTTIERTAASTQNIHMKRVLPFNTGSGDPTQHREVALRSGSGLNWYARGRSDGLPLSFYGKGKEPKDRVEILEKKEPKDWVIHVKDELRVESEENLRFPRSSKNRRRELLNHHPQSQNDRSLLEA